MCDWLIDLDRIVSNADANEAPSHIENVVVDGQPTSNRSILMQTLQQLRAEKRNALTNRAGAVRVLRC